MGESIVEKIVSLSKYVILLGANALIAVIRCVLQRNVVMSTEQVPKYDSAETPLINATSFLYEKKHT
jgi:hypothetical protein